MASAAKEYRYAHRELSTQGNLVRDLDWAVRERELEHAGEASRRGKTQTLDRAKIHEERLQIRERQRVPVVTVLGASAVIVMAVMLLFSYVQLTTLAGDTVALKTELSALEAENVTLTAQHEQMFDMAAVKEAASAAGMGKPSSSQVTYLDLTGEDSVTVYQAEHAEGSLLTRALQSLHNGFYALLEYFD